MYLSENVDNFGFWCQTLKRVGLYLDKPCFSHGQLYVAMSRVSKPQDITIYLDPEENQHGIQHDVAYTRNVFYRGLIQKEIDKFKKTDDYEGDDLFDQGISPFTSFKFFYYVRWNGWWIWLSYDGGDDW